MISSIPTGTPSWTACRPGADAFVRGWIESNLDPSIQRAVVQPEPGIRAEVVQLISGAQSEAVEDSNEIDSPDTSEDWAWTRSNSIRSRAQKATRA